MATWQEYDKRLEAIRAGTNFRWQTIAEARDCLAELRLKQQELRTLKSDIKLEMKNMRQAGVIARAQVGTLKSPVPGLFTSFRSRVAGKRFRLRQEELGNLMPYEATVRNVDKAIQELDHKKLEINRWIAAQKPAR